MPLQPQQIAHLLRNLAYPHKDSGSILLTILTTTILDQLYHSHFIIKFAGWVLWNDKITYKKVNALPMVYNNPLLVVLVKQQISSLCISPLNAKLQTSFGHIFSVFPGI